MNIRLIWWVLRLLECVFDDLISIECIALGLADKNWSVWCTLSQLTIDLKKKKVLRGHTKKGSTPRGLVWGSNLRLYV